MTPMAVGQPVAQQTPTPTPSPETPATATLLPTPVLTVTPSAAPHVVLEPASSSGTRVKTVVRRDRTWPRNPPWDACPAPAWRTPTVAVAPASTASPGAGRRVLFVWDSLTRESQAMTTSLLRWSGWTTTFRCWGSRRLDWGLAQVSRARALHQLPGFVVVALGTNDVSWESQATTAARVAALLKRIGPNRQILWVNLHITRSAWLNARADWFNDLLARWDRRLENLTVIDWHKVARAHDIRGWDGIHYGPSGFRLRAQTIAKALDARARTLLEKRADARS